MIKLFPFQGVPSLAPFGPQLAPSGPRSQEGTEKDAYFGKNK